MKRITKPAAACLAAGGALFLGKGLDSRLETTHYQILSRKIPPGFNGYKIVQISDYHCDYIPKLVETIRIEKPNIIVSTGDMVNDKGSFEPAVRLFFKLSHIAPVYAVTGNHDVWRGDYRRMMRSFESAGASFLHNKRVFFTRGDAKISLSGIADPYSRVSEKITRTLHHSLDMLDRYDGFDILLFHRANLLDELKNRGFDLILSGHMHGGQVRLPGIGGMVSPKTNMAERNSRMLFPHYFGGLYDAGHTKMIVSRGLGNPMIVPRIFNRPELVVIELEHQTDTVNAKKQ
jgi:predicted MPP superfamily phosphohydrolase